MRTRSAGERAVLAGARYAVHLRVEVEDADAAWVDLSTVGGTDWVRDVQWSDTLDQAVMSGTLTLHRGLTTASLAPFMEASLLNRDAATDYAPLIHPARGLRLSTACVDVGTTPVAGDWTEVLLGRIDSVDVGGDAVRVAFRDKGADLLNVQIETAIVYGSPGGTLVETVMQSILTDNSTGVTLYVPTSPGWAVTEYQQSADTNVLEALRALALQFGWDVRYRYDASDVFRLTLWQPDRTASVPDDTFGPDEYLSVDRLDLSDSDIRNVVTVVYSGGTVTREDTASIAIYGRRAMVLAEETSSNIDTLAEAEALADAALADLALPPVDQAITNLYWWPVQLGDYYTWESNGVQYDVDQALAVVGYRHQVSGGSGRTTIECRGQPAGAYRRWLKGESTGIALRAEVSSFGFRTNPITDAIEVYGTVNDLCQSLTWWLSEAFDAPGLDPLVGSPALVDGLGATKQFGFTFTLPDGKSTSLFIQPWAGASGSAPIGLLYETPVARSPRTTVSFQPRDPTGRVSAEWAQVSFGVRPSIPPHPGGSGTITGSTAATITDSGAAWTVNAFAYNAEARVFYYVRAGGEVARILSNTATVLTVDPEFSVAPAGVYAIYEGATLYKVSDSVGGFIPVVQPVYLQRGLLGIVLEFYSEINRALPEAVNRFTIDADDTAEIDALDVEEVQPNVLEWAVRGYDDDVKRWLCYVKKGAQPTVDGSLTGALDPSFLRFDDVIEEPRFRMSAGDGTWYGIAVPINSYNDRGPRVDASITVNGTPTLTATLTNLTVAKLVSVGVLNHRIAWNHSVALESPDATWELKVFAYRGDQGAAAAALVSAANRRAWQDSAALFDANPADDAEVTAAAGALQVKAGTDGSAVERVWYYRLELWTGGVRRATYTANRRDLYGLNAPTSFALSTYTGSTYGGKTYGTQRFTYTANELRTGANTEMYEQHNNATLNLATATLVATVPAGTPPKVTKLIGPIGDFWYYWIRNVTPDRSAATATVGPLAVEYVTP